ncbi:hypothetical protein BGZ72_004934 [Mortierella alpina]|nr:hypothetical protein BGZ72_004934 [Mortierella alpina]
MTMEEFMDAHVNHHSMHNNVPVAQFYFPKSKPSGPDLGFFIRIDGRVALSTVSATKIEGHAKNLRQCCPDNVYISMIIAYPTKWTSKLPEFSDLPKDTSGVQQVVINIGDNNFGDIFPKEHVEFIDRLKNAGKRSADDSESDGESHSKKQKN